MNGLYTTLLTPLISVAWLLLDKYCCYVIAIAIGY